MKTIQFLGLCGNNKRYQSYNDGILEVFGINSSFHMAQLQVGLSAPKAFGQAKVIEVSIFFNGIRNFIFNCFFLYFR